MCNLRGTREGECPTCAGKLRRSESGTKCENEQKLCARLAGCVCLSDRFCARCCCCRPDWIFLSGSKDGVGLCRAAEAAGSDAGGYAVHAIWDGLTLISLYCLLTALAQRKTRFLAICMLAIAAIPAVSLLLNGLLYARGKILIPFLLPMLLLCALVFCGFPAGKREAAALGRRVVSASMGGCLRRKRQHPDKQAFAD